jgi:hypothetical protein
MHMRDILCCTQVIQLKRIVFCTVFAPNKFHKLKYLLLRLCSRVPRRSKMNCVIIHAVRSYACNFFILKHMMPGSKTQLFMPVISSFHSIYMMPGKLNLKMYYA